MGRSIFLSAKGKAKEIPAQNRQQGREFGKFFRLPWRERVRRNIAPRQMENHWCQMPAATGHMEIDFRGGQVVGRFAVDGVHGGIRL
jgi:hypothetical protein